MWIKSYPGSITTPDPYIGNSLYYIFNINGVFSIWFPDDLHIATYTYALNSYYDNFTTP